MPAGYVATKPAPLVLMLHGATGSARGALRPFRELADEAGLVLLAPESRGTTWDAIRGDYGPDIAFIDIGMPRMDGYEAARRIRRVLGSQIVLVALTGWGQEQDKERARDAGFDHHLTKPAEPELLESLIGDCADRRNP